MVVVAEGGRWNDDRADRMSEEAKGRTRLIAEVLVVAKLLLRWLLLMLLLWG